jgi:hypothetical protein
VSAAPRQETQEEILEAALASLTDEDIPAAAWPTDFGPRDRSGDGPGFADGGVLDVLAAGLPLAGFAADAQDSLGQVTDDELVGVLRAWRRVASWAAASELAAVAELARRRPADGSPPAAPGRLPLKVSEFVPDEVAAALTLTGRAAADQAPAAPDQTGTAADQGRTAADQTRTAADGAAVPAGLHRPVAWASGAGLPPLAGSVNLTIPLATLLGLSQAAGAAAGYGPLDPATARALACAAAGHRDTRWHITVTARPGVPSAMAPPVPSRPPAATGRWP